MILRLGPQAVFIFILLFLMQSTGMASGIEWSGNYRLGFVQLENPSMQSGGATKEYIHHHLVLKPKIVAADGLNIYGRFDVFNSSQSNQVGLFLGGDESMSTNPATFPDSNSSSHTLNGDYIMATQLYLVLNNEYGAFIAGRAPFHFGLGMVHNSGDGLFDNFFDTRDMIGYKMVFGNYFVLPSIAKLNEGALSRNIEDVSEYNIHVELDNPESDTRLGLMYSMRRSAAAGNDTPSSINGVSYNTVLDGVDYNLMNLFFQKTWGVHKVGAEFANYSGDFGVDNGTGDKLEATGSGIAFEYDWKPKAKNYSAGFKAGRATGDDISNTDKYEGFAFDRNYDVGLILFNHYLGDGESGSDVLQTNIFGGGTSADVEADFESISNVTYFAPYFDYQWKENLSLKTSLITGSLSETLVDGESNLGIELDVSLTYKPHESFVWVNSLGYLSPGSAFDSVSDSKSFFALFSKIAISF